MLKKRKSAATTPTTSKTTAKTIATPSPAPPKKQKKLDVQPKIEQQLPKIVEQPPPPKIEEKQPPIEEQLEEVEEEIEEEIEEEVEEEVEEEEESEEEQEQDEETTEQQQQEQEEEQEEEDEDDEPISSLIEPFTKDQLTTIVREAAEKHADVATIVRKLADKDIVHRKIFIHGLGWDTTTETLISAFKDYGEIEDCKAVTDKLTGKSKGYGFIVFKTRTGARKALKEPQKTISGRTASCQLAALGASANNSEKGSGSGFNAAAPPVVGFQTEYTQRKIYISNVSAELDPAKLTAYFSRFGEIEDGPLGIDKGTGKFKGFCLFVYKSVESARKALEEPHKLYEGHTLHCQRAIDGPKPGKGYSGHSGGSYGTGGHGRGGGSGYVRGQNPSLPIVSGGGLVGQGMVGAGVNPALGHALTALLASQGAGLGLNNLLGSLGSSGVTNMGQSSGYGAPVGLSGYGSQTGLQSVYPNPQLGQGGGVGRSQHGGYSGAPYGGH